MTPRQSLEDHRGESEFFGKRHSVALQESANRLRRLSQIKTRRTGLLIYRNSYHLSCFKIISFEVPGRGSKAFIINGIVIFLLKVS